MIKSANLRLEVFLVAAVLLLAAVARLGQLDRWPLTDLEATHALAASTASLDEVDFWPEGSDRIIPSPIYHLLTSSIFGVFGTSNIAARVIPGLLGCFLLLFLAFNFREGPPGMKLVWLFCLSFSPVLVTSSRTASGDITAATAVFILFIVMIHHRKQEGWVPVGLALTAGIGLAAGVAVFKAASTVALGLTLVLILQRNQIMSSIQGELWREAKRIVWIVPLVTLFVVTGFGTSLAGMQGFANAIGEWLLGWTRSSGFSLVELIVLLVRTEPVIVLFGIIGVIRTWKREDLTSRWTALWAAGAGIFLIAYPGRSPFDLIWIVLPLSYLASVAIIELLGGVLASRTKLELFGLLGLLIAFVASGALSLVAYGSGNVLTINPDNPNLVLFLFLALAVMGLSVLVFFGLGWSWTIVIQAAGMLLLVISAAQGVSSLWRLNYSQEGQQVADLWWQRVPTRGMDLMVASVEQAAVANSGIETQLQVELQGDPSPAMAWALRDFEERRGGTAFGAEAAPVILARETAMGVDLRANYVGQSLGLFTTQAWETLLPPNLLQWWINNEAPTQNEPWVLWVRADIASFGDIELEN
jgi:hypothetical protein